MRIAALLLMLASLAASQKYTVYRQKADQGRSLGIEMVRGDYVIVLANSTDGPVEIGGRWPWRWRAMEETGDHKPRPCSKAGSYTACGWWTTSWPTEFLRVEVSANKEARISLAMTEIGVNTIPGLTPPIPKELR